MELMWNTLVPVIFLDKEMSWIWEKDILKLKMILILRFSFLYVEKKFKGQIFEL